MLRELLCCLCFCLDARLLLLQASRVSFASCCPAFLMARLTASAFFSSSVMLLRSAAVLLLLERLATGASLRSESIDARFLAPAFARGLDAGFGGGGGGGGMSSLRPASTKVPVRVKGGAVSVEHSDSERRRVFTEHSPAISASFWFRLSTNKLMVGF